MPDQTSLILDRIGDLQNTVEDPMNARFSARLSKKNTEIEELANEALELEFGDEEESKEEELPTENMLEGILEI